MDVERRTNIAVVLSCPRLDRSNDFVDSLAFELLHEAEANRARTGVDAKFSYSVLPFEAFQSIDNGVSAFHGGRVCSNVEVDGQLLIEFLDHGGSGSPDRNVS